MSKEKPVQQFTKAHLKFVEGIKTLRYKEFKQSEHLGKKERGVCLAMSLRWIQFRDQGFGEEALMDKLTGDEWETIRSDQQARRRIKDGKYDINKLGEEDGAKFTTGKTTRSCWNRGFNKTLNSISKAITLMIAHRGLYTYSFWNFPFGTKGHAVAFDTRGTGAADGWLYYMDPNWGQVWAQDDGNDGIVCKVFMKYVELHYRAVYKSEYHFGHRQLIQYS